MEQKIDLIPLLRDGESFTCPYPLPLNGIIAIGIFTRAQIEALHQLSDTLVFVDSSPDEARSDSGVINYRLGIEHALDHLFSLGHRQIGFVGPADKLDDWKQPAPEVRRQLFIHFMSARNDYDSSFLIDVSTNAALTERAVTEHLSHAKTQYRAHLALIVLLISQRAGSFQDTAARIFAGYHGGVIIENTRYGRNRKICIGCKLFESRHRQHRLFDQLHCYRILPSKFYYPF